MKIPHRKYLLGLASLLPAIFVISCTEAGGAPAFLENQSFPGAGASANGGLDAFDSLKNGQGAQKLVYHVGPVDLNRGASAELMLENPQSLNFQVSEPVWVVGFRPEVVDSQGNPLPGKLLYKAMLLNKHEPNPVCASGSSGNPFAVATSAMTKVEIPDGFGYPLLPDDPLEARVIFQNPTDQDFLGVTFSFELETIPMDKAKGFTDVKAMLLDTDPCDHKPTALEPGAFVEQNKTFTLPDSGHLMVANGVLSNYGVAVSLTHQKEGDVSVLPFWRAEARLDENHNIVDLTPNPFMDPEGVEIGQGDKMTLGVTFDNFSDSWNNEATGGAMIYLAPEAS